MGNHMISSAILALIGRSKDIKIAQDIYAPAICSLLKIYKCLSHQIAREIMLQLVSNVHEKKNQRKSRQTKF